MVPGAHAQINLGMPAPDTHVMRLGPYTYHWSQSAEHKPVVSLALDVPCSREDGSFRGAAFFSNSFGQPSVYAYYGYKYARPFGLQDWYWHVTAGLMYGYKEPYEHKVPFNYKGLSPAIVPSIGYQLNARAAVEMQVLGSAGLMFSWVQSLD